jgi:hypothetical protein
VKLQMHWHRRKAVVVEEKPKVMSSPLAVHVPIGITSLHTHTWYLETLRVSHVQPLNDLDSICIAFPLETQTLNHPCPLTAVTHVRWPLLLISFLS